MPAGTIHEGTPRKICGGCSASYDAIAWEHLEPCGAIRGEEVKTIVTAWPESAVIDLRRCARCRMILARRRST